jgi:hypothetical protein
MAEVGLTPSVWLHQTVPNADETPFELLCAGRLADVAQIVEIVAAGAEPGDLSQIVSGAHREHDVITEEMDDEAKWDVGEWSEDDEA